MAQILRVAALAAILFLAVAARAALLPLPAPDLAERAFLDGATPVPTADLRVIGLGPSGAIFVAGDFDSVDGMSRPHGVARLNPDGTLDAGWSPTLPFSRTALRAAEAADGAVAMSFATGSPASGEALVRIPAGGGTGVVVETTEEGEFQALAFDAEGALYFAKSRFLGTFPDLGPPKPHYEVDVRKADTNGTVLPSFALLVEGDFNECTHFSSAQQPRVHALLALGDHLYVGGNFDTASNPATSAANAGAMRVWRATGDIDAAWAPLGPSNATSAFTQAKTTCIPRPNGVVHAIAAGAGDTVYLAGPFQRVGRNGLARFSRQAPGAADTWQPEIQGHVNAIALDPAGDHLYAVGSFTVEGGNRRTAAFSTVDATSVPWWDADVMGAAALVGTPDAVLLAGSFAAVSGEPRQGAAALPVATAPFSGPLLAIEPRHVDAGGIRLNTTRQAVATLRNAGGAPLTITSIVAPVPPPDGALTFTHWNDCPAVLAPATACQVTAEFSVSELYFFGSAVDVPITVTSDGSALPQPIVVSAKVAAPAFPQAPSLQIPAPPLGHPMSATRTVTNVGNAPMEITGMTIESETRPGEFSVTHDCPASLAPGASCDATISYTPQGLGEADAVVLVAFAELTYVYGAIGGYALEARFQAHGQPAGPADDSDGDGIPNGMEEAEGLDPVVKDNDIFSNARLFAMQQYRDFLGREGDAGGIAFWANQVAAGHQSRGQAIESFFNSQEFQGTIAPVARLYFAYFLRVPDYGGLTFWAQYYKANSLLAISNFFAVSPEFASTYGALGNAAFVTLVYNNVLGRAPDAAGHAFWTHQLDTGAMTRGQVMLGFSESAEYRALTRNEVYVTMMYIGMLRRAPDPGGFAFWVDYLDGGKSGLALIDGFLGSTEYRRRFLP